MWEKQKLKNMKSILLHKYQQNADLCDKLIETDEAPLIYCDRDGYWGTNKSMFDRDWEKTFTYPGRNALGVCLEDVRRRLRPAGFKASQVSEKEVTSATVYKNISHSDMEGIACGLNEAGKADGGVSDSQITEVKSTQPGNTKVNDSDSSNPACIKPGQATVQELAAKIKPTVLPLPDKGKSREGEDTVSSDRKTGNGEGQEDLDSASIDSLERENNLLHVIRTTLLPNPDQSVIVSNLNKRDSQNIGDSISIVDSTWEESLVMGNITHDDGCLNRDKMASWVIPTVEKSTSLEKSFMVLKEGVEYTSESKTHESAKGPQHSTPVVTKLSKKEKIKKRKSQSKDLGLRERTLQMLDDLDL